MNPHAAADNDRNDSPEAPAPLQLSYRGHSYEVSDPVVEATATDHTIAFMGQTCPLKQYQVEQPQQPPEELTFMGQRYIRDGNAQPQPYKPRPGEKVINSRQLMQLQRSRAAGRHNPAFRSR